MVHPSSTLTSMDQSPQNQRSPNTPNGSRDKCQTEHAESKVNATHTTEYKVGKLRIKKAAYQV